MAMAFATLNPPQSRQLAIGLLVAAVLAVALVVALPVWLMHRYYNEAIADNAGKLERYARIAGARAEVAKQLEAMRAKEPRRFFLRSGAAALSAAEAQEIIRGIVEGQGGKLISIQPPTSKEEGRYRQITSNVQIQANIFALRKILHAIETNVPYLFVDNLSVRTQVPPGHRPQPGNEPEMFVTFDVAGYAVTGA
jgi:general secretion pathway protein M